jgi:6,7-dimethyl-8-ribityllumazine synthase
MATQGNTLLHKGIPNIEDAFVVIVKTEWNAHIVDALEEGAIKVLNAQGIKHKTVVVPGAFEIPFMINSIAKNSKEKASAFIALATVIQGDTPHFDYVCQGITNGITQLNLALDVPTIFGVLTVLTEEQAIDRIGGKHGHKGEEAAITAVKMIHLNNSVLGT